MQPSRNGFGACTTFDALDSLGGCLSISIAVFGSGQLVPVTWKNSLIKVSRTCVHIHTNSNFFKSHLVNVAVNSDGKRWFRLGESRMQGLLLWFASNRGDLIFMWIFPVSRHATHVWGEIDSNIPVVSEVCARRSYSTLLGCFRKVANAVHYLSWM